MERDGMLARLRSARFTARAGADPAGPTAAGACGRQAPRKLGLKEKALVLKKRHSEFSAWKTMLLAAVLGFALAVWGAEDARDISSGAGADGPDRLDAAATGGDRAFVAAFVGDVMRGRGAPCVAGRYGYDALFRKASPLWADADYVLGNLECTLIDDESAYERARKGEHFRCSDEAASALADAGFTVLQTANDHTVDYGSAGLLHTIEVLKGNGIDAVGAGENLAAARKPVERSYGSLTVKTFAASDIVPERTAAGERSAGILPLDGGGVCRAVADARDGADLIVVGAHWGLDYARDFSAEQQRMARSLIDAGADIVVGTHSRALEPIELYNGGIIFYGLGNFVADDAQARGRDSVVVRFTVGEDGASSFEVSPLRIVSGIPRPTDDPISIERDWSMLTRALEEKDYRIESGKLSIPFKTIGVPKEP